MARKSAKSTKSTKTAPKATRKAAPQAQVTTIRGAKGIGRVLRNKNGSGFVALYFRNGKRIQVANKRVDVKAMNSPHLFGAVTKALNTGRIAVRGDEKA